MSRQHLWRACKKGAPKPPKSDSVDLSEPFKSNFDKVVKNIALESKKSKYNPKIGMNWCYLPTEMRLECVKHLDFKTRCGFRGVSKSEKALVDWKKYKFKHLQIFFEDKMVADERNIWYIEAKSGNGRPEIHIRTKNRLSEKCLTAIFKYAEVENFRLLNKIFDGYKVFFSLDQLAPFAPFPFKRVSIFLNPSVDFFMRNCPNLEKIDVNGELPYHRMLNLPSLIEIKEFKFHFVGHSNLLEFLPGLVQKWIDNDVEVGKSVQHSISVGGNWQTLRLFDTFTKKFADRIIEKTDREVRIRMNNEKKQILMRKICCTKDDWKDRSTEFCSCKVIPIDLPKSEYEKGDEWIQAIYERYKQLDNPKIFEPEDFEIWRCLKI